MVGSLSVKSGFDIECNADRDPTLRALYLTQTKNAILKPIRVNHVKHFTD